MIEKSKRRYVLFASLALNVFLVGAIASHLWARSHRHGDADRRPHMGRFFKEHRAELKESRGAMRAAHRAVEVALTTEPLDEPTLIRALAELRNSSTQVQQKMHTALVTSARDLPVSERRELARALHRKPGRRPESR